MKGSSKAISSPGRTEKFPPPLMRFLRSNVGSRSRGRGRTRASPMMFMRRNKNNVVIETTQEPSSPKVTCIGQVRVRRSGNNGRTRTQRSKSTTKQQQQKKRERKQKQQPYCCCNCRVKPHKPKPFISVLKKWICCCPFGHRGKKDDSTCTSRVESSTQRVETRVSNTSIASASTTESNEKIGIFEESENEEQLVGSVPNPPKDALILTRCRSAPYRSSSLASRFWGSPMNHSSSNDTTKSQSPQNIFEYPILGSRNSHESGELAVGDTPKCQRSQNILENPISPVGENGDLGSRKSCESEELAVRDTTKSRSPQKHVRELENENPVLENHNGEEMQRSINDESSKEGEVYVHPLLLTRCKSEPARTGERLNPTRFSELDSQS